MNTRLAFLADALERHPGRTLALVGALFAVAYVGTLTLFPRPHGRLVDGDAIQYYAYLRSAAFDRDLDFANDYRLLYRPVDGSSTNVWLTAKTPIGRAPNLMSIGPGLLWAPFFASAVLIVAAGRGMGLTVPLDGVAAPFQLSAGIAGICYATLGAYFCYRTCRLLFSGTAALWGTLAAWLATPAIYYSLVSPAYSHATSLFAVALFSYQWARTRGDRRVSRYLTLGLLAGLAALVRWQDGLVLVLPLAELVRIGIRHNEPSTEHALSLTDAGARALILAAAAALAFVPQLVAWQQIFGSAVLVPQGEGFMRWTEPALASVLWSWRHGLFTWTPAVLIAVAGYWLLARRDPGLAWAALAILGLSTYVNGAVVDWWAGEAFGARRFVGNTVFFALGFSAVFSRRIWQTRPWRVRLAASAFIIYNVLFLLQYQLFMRGYRDLVPYPTTPRQVLLDRLVVPWQLLTRMTQER